MVPTLDKLRQWRLPADKAVISIANDTKCQVDVGEPEAVSNNIFAPPTGSGPPAQARTHQESAHAQGLGPSSCLRQRDGGISRSGRPALNHGMAPGPPRVRRPMPKVSPTLFAVRLRYLSPISI
jgi:hypothetical protein